MRHGSRPSLRNGTPLRRLPDLIINPKGHHVIAAIASGKRAELVHRHEEVGRRNCRARDGRRGLGEQPLHKRGPFELGHRGERHHRVQRTALGTAKQLKRCTSRVTRDLVRPLAASFALEGVGLINHPVANGRQNLSLSSNVAQQQRMVGHHHVAAGGTTARAMDQALVGKVRAARAKALVGGSSEHLSRHIPPADP